MNPYDELSNNILQEQIKAMTQELERRKKRTESKDWDEVYRVITNYISTYGPIHIDLVNDGVVVTLDKLSVHDFRDKGIITRFGSAILRGEDEEE